MILDHGIPLHLQNIRIAAPREITQRKGLSLLDRFQGPACRNATHERKLLDFPIEHLLLHWLRQLHNFDRAALVVPAADKPFLLQRGDVLVHRGQRSELQALADFLKAWRVAVLRFESHEIIQNFFLPLG